MSNNLPVKFYVGVNLPRMCHFPVGDKKLYVPSGILDKYGVSVIASAMQCQFQREVFWRGYRKKQVGKIYAYHLMLLVVRTKNLFKTTKWHGWAQGQDKLASASSYTLLARIYRGDNLRIGMVEGGEMKTMRNELSLTKQHITVKHSHISGIIHQKSNLWCYSDKFCIHVIFIPGLHS